MNKNGVIAVVVVVAAVVLVGLWAMRSGQQTASGRMDCSSAPAAPTDVSPAKKGDVVTLNWKAPSGTEPVATYVIESGTSPGANNSATFVTPGTVTTIQRQIPTGTYYGRVYARNACGSSAPSSEVVVTVP